MTMLSTRKANKKASFPFMATFRTFYINAGQHYDRRSCNTNWENTCYPSLYMTLDSPLIIQIKSVNSSTECSERKVSYPSLSALLLL